MDKRIEQIISLLQQGKLPPEEYHDLLFPIEHKEYELTYKGKTPKEQIIAIGEEPQSIPFQIEKTFGEKQKDNEWQNLLIFGDNFQVLKTLNENKDSLIVDKVKGKVKLIYIDPPFATADEFSNKLGAKAYSDKIKGAQFLEFLRQRLILAKELLAEDGSIFVHLDTKMSHYIKIIMDEVFGKNNFVNEIIWQYFMGGKGKKEFAKKHDTIFYYAKNKGEHVFNPLIVKRYYDFKPSLGDDSENAESGHDEFGYWGKVKCPDVWQIRGVFNMGKEYSSYPTQKPEALIERIIKATTQKGDLVMDFFAGSGTTLAVAEKLNRKWIGVDIGKLSIYTIQKRLITLPHTKPFALVNAGCYDLKKVFEMERQKYVDFVCELFHITKQTKKIRGITVDGKRLGDWVKIYEWQEFEKTHTAVDEAFIEELNRNIGEKVGEKFYIVAPEINVDIIGDYYRPSGSNTKYYLLKIPYQYIKDLHKIDFKKLNQPKNKLKINSIENSVGFYFNEIPDVKSRVEKEKEHITIFIDSCNSQFIQDEKDILAMVLIDTTDDKNFIMEKVYFADDIRNKDTSNFLITLSLKEIKSSKIKVVYVDIYGNEFVEVLEV